MNIRNSYLSTF